MKKLLQFSFIAIVFSTLFSSSISAQTSGTLTFTVNLTAKSGSYGSDHYVAVWIENASNTFIKTKVKYADSHATGSHNHLPAWKAANPSLNVVDATTGASLSSYTTPITFTWNATDVAGNVAADGNVNVRVEYTWGSTTSTSNTTYSFTKGPTPVTLNPANEPNFTNVTLNWTPATSSVNNSMLINTISIYPNPVKDIININFLQSLTNCKITLENIIGQTVFEENSSLINIGNKSIDVSKFTRGIYFVNINSNNQNIKYKVILE